MKTTFFKNFTNPQELKKIWKKLVLTLHPDQGGNEQAFIKMQAEYEFLVQLGERAFDANLEEDEIKILDFLLKAYEKINHLDITIELVGNWIWLTGDTKACKEIIKEAGFKWARKKAAWYIHDGTWKGSSRKHIPLEEIKNNYGSKKMKNKSRFKLA